MLYLLYHSTVVAFNNHQRIQHEGGTEFKNSGLILMVGSDRSLRQM
jgi:hypothetical protein